MPVMMRSLLIALAVVVIVVVGILAWAVSVNNQLVVAEQNVNEKWAQVQNVYQRRADLVPNLVETVKGFAAQERTVLEEVTRARASASSIQLTPQALGDPKALERFQAAQNQLSGALSRLLVTVERYPDLKSNANFLALQTQLEGTENRITVERRRWSGDASTRRCATTTRACACSPVLWSRRWQATSPRPSSRPRGTQPPRPR